MSLSKEAQYIFDLIKWVANKNDKPFAIIGFEAFARNLLKQTDQDFDKRKINKFITELSKSGLVHVEDCKSHIKYYISSPSFSKLSKNISNFLSKKATDYRKFRITKSMNGINELVLKIESIYIVNELEVVIGFLTYQFLEAEASELEEKSCAASKRLFLVLLQDLYKLESNLLKVINFHEDHDSRIDLTDQYLIIRDDDTLSMQSETCH
jgi:hypothetical protein